MFAYGDGYSELADKLENILMKALAYGGFQNE